MRRTRQFRPEGLAPLEDRVVLSSIALLGHHHAAPHVKLPAAVKAAINANPNPTPDSVIKGSVGDFKGLNMAQTVKAGNPVYEVITGHFSDGTTQTEARQITPDPAAGTITTSKIITLRNNIGQKRVVDVATTSGATTTHNITTTLPGGATETETKTDLVQGSKTFFKGTITLPGGSTKSFTGVITPEGKRTVTEEADTDAEGFVTRSVTVDTLHDELSQSTTTTTTYPDGTTTTSNFNTFVLRLKPPSH